MPVVKNSLHVTRRIAKLNNYVHTCLTTRNTCLTTRNDSPQEGEIQSFRVKTTLYLLLLLLTLLLCIWQGARKFDVRAWILVTNWNPLTVWMYEPYFRVCTEEHSLDKKSLSNHYKHLCNRCVQATNEDYDDGDGEGGCMWSVETMTEYLNKFGDGAELWENIRRQIMHISQMCMHSVQDLVDNKLVCVCVCV